MPAPKEKPFASEVDLCAQFLAAIGDDWTPFAETQGWDILLVRKSDGFQIGIEAKLKLNLDVINQAIEEYGWNAMASGPDCRAVLVPYCEASGFDRIAAYIGFTIIRMQHGHCYGDRFRPDLPKEGPAHQWDDWHEWCPAKRHALPEYVPDVAAGASAPLQLTKWKILAIKIAVTLERRGYVTRADFKRIGIDHRRWTAKESGWLLVSEGRYIAGPGLPAFKKQHPKVWEQVAADSAKWMAAEPATLL